MNPKSTFSILFIFLTILFFSSCGSDSDFHSIREIEDEIHNKINSYRIEEGLSSISKNYLVFNEARTLSDRMSNGTYEITDPGLQQYLDNFTQNLGGNGNGLVTMISDIENADSIVNAMLGDSATAALIKKDFTLSGVGVSPGNDGLFYVCHMFINIPD